MRREPARGFLGRLASDDPARRLEVIDAIIANLQSIINTERGGSLSVPGLGLPLNELLLRWPISLIDLLDAVKANIERYEPRLKNVTVSAPLGESNDRLELLIEAELSDTPVSFTTRLTGTGGVDVEAKVGGMKSGSST